MRFNISILTHLPPSDEGGVLRKQNGGREKIECITVSLPQSTAVDSSLIRGSEERERNSVPYERYIDRFGVGVGILDDPQALMKTDGMSGTPSPTT